MADVFESIFSSIEAFIYRCRNDADYTMEYIEGSLQALTGYSTAQMLRNTQVSWMGITREDDLDHVVSTVDKAIEARQPWDVVYRVVHQDGQDVWVRERGSAVFEDGKLAYLQGLIVSAASETRLRNEREALLERTTLSNQEILGLSSQIIDSVKKLSILSINARIEAARSGQAGRGFAVIANEIHRLAEENGNWAGIITTKLKDAQSSRGHPPH